MFNFSFGFVMFMISIAFFALILFVAAPYMEGHIALAILCASMFGMGGGLVLMGNN